MIDGKDDVKPGDIIAYQRRDTQHFEIGLVKSVVNDGGWQGTLVYIIPEEGYQPREYWYVRVGYGSCSWCDAFLGIEQGSGTSDEKVDDYMAMSLHVVQGVRRMEGDVV